MLSAAGRDALIALRAGVLPGSEAAPSADEADPDGRYLDEALRLRADLAGALEAITSAIPDAAAPDALARLEAAAPDDLGLLVFFIAGAYFLSPDARAAVAYEPAWSPVMAENLDRLIAPVEQGWRNLHERQRG